MSLYGSYDHRSFWHGIRPVWLLAISILLGFAIGLIGDTASVCPPAIPDACLRATDYLAQHNGLVVYYHQYYQLFTSIFVTRSTLDAVFNVLAIFIFDRLTYDNFSKSEYFLIFFVTAILGNLFTLLQGPFYASAGASGGIFGIFAAILSYSWFKEKKIERTTLVFFLIVFLASSFFISNVNWVAHFGGAVGGFLMGPVIYYFTGQNDETRGIKTRKSHYLDIATMTAIFLMIIGSAVQFLLFAL